MKTMRMLSILVLVSLMLVPMVLARGGGGRTGFDPGAMVMELPYQEVDATERDDLLHMREEEKLARDVYLALDDIWGLRVFRQIANAERFHMDSVLALLEKYGISDPVGDNPDGVFVDPELQSLFNQLVAQGSESLNEALIVGATIEDMDIFDLANALGRTDNEDIQLVYENLQRGSRNHLRAFVFHLEANGVTYTPQYISQEEFDSIVTSAWETGRSVRYGRGSNRTASR
jgi:hypothetical protein